MGGKSYKARSENVPQLKYNEWGYKNPYKGEYFQKVLLLSNVNECSFEMIVENFRVAWKNRDYRTPSVIWINLRKAFSYSSSRSQDTFFPIMLCYKVLRGSVLYWIGSWTHRLQIKSRAMLILSAPSLSLPFYLMCFLLGL